MKKVFFSLICLVGLSACSTENAVVGSLKTYDVTNSSCKREVTMTDLQSNPREDDRNKLTKLSIELGKDGVAQCRVEDVRDNCAIRERVVNVSNECWYDVDFKMGKISQGNYRLKVYYAGSVVKCDNKLLAYDGEINLAQGKVTQVTLKSGVLLPVD